jgi:hypothetical protein
MNLAVGYRIWRPDDAWLVSPFYPTTWPQSTRLEAICRDEPENFVQRGLPRGHKRELAAPPVARCSCGIYAYHEAGNMLAALDAQTIGGAVLCWGRITIHPEGIRAQFARPIALCRPEPWWNAEQSQPVLLRIATSYRIPLLESSCLTSYAGEFGDSYRPGPAELAARAEARPGRVLRRLLRRLIDA